MEGDDRASRSLALVFVLSWSLVSAYYWLILGTLWGVIAVLANALVLVVFVMSCLVARTIQSTCGLSFQRPNAEKREE
jgi:hypothetical protein